MARVRRPRLRRLPIWACALALAPGLACGAPASKPAAKPSPELTADQRIAAAAKTVAELTVVAPAVCLDPKRSLRLAPRPKVVSSFPARGAVVAPGLLVIRLTFDRPMACLGGLSRDFPLPDPCAARQRLLLTYDRMTVRVVCLVDPGVDYGLLMNSGVSKAMFVSLEGRAAQPYELSFATSTAPQVTSVCQALVADQIGAREIEKRHPLDCDRVPPAAGPAGG